MKSGSKSGRDKDNKKMKAKRKEVSQSDDSDNPSWSSHLKHKNAYPTCTDIELVKSIMFWQLHAHWCQSFPSC